MANPKWDNVPKQPFTVSKDTEITTGSFGGGDGRDAIPVVMFAGVMPDGSKRKLQTIGDHKTALLGAQANGTTLQGQFIEVPSFHRHDVRIDFRASGIQSGSRSSGGSRSYSGGSGYSGGYSKGYTGRLLSIEEYQTLQQEVLGKNLLNILQQVGGKIGVAAQNDHTCIAAMIQVAGTLTNTTMIAIKDNVIEMGQAAQAAAQSTQTTAPVAAPSPQQTMLPPEAWVGNAEAEDLARRIQNGQLAELNPLPGKKKSSFATEVDGSDFGENSDAIKSALHLAIFKRKKQLEA